MLDAERPLLDVPVRPAADRGSGRITRLGSDVLRKCLELLAAHRWLKLTIVSLFVINGVLSLMTNVYWLVSDYVYAKDFIQEYLLSMAIVRGDNPYLPIDQLSRLYLGELPPTAFPFDHPTPHPASIGIVLLPLAGLDYASAATVWFGIGVVSLVGTVLLLARGDGIRLPWWKVLLIVVGLIGWAPVRRELLLGQPMPLIAFLVAAARAALFSGRPTLAGASIGGALLLKPVPWMILLVLPLRRQFGALAAALVTLLAGAVASVAVVGSTTIIAYATEVLPSVSAIYVRSGVNISVQALVWRVFHGTDSYALGEFFTPPSIVVSSSLAAIVSILLQVLIVLVMIHMARAVESTDQALSIGICLSIMINPIAWGSYLMLAMIPLWSVGSSLWYRRFPVRETYLAALVVGLLSVPIALWIVMAQHLAGVTPTSGTTVELPALVSFLTFTPDLALAVLVWLVLRSSRSPMLGQPGRLR